MLTGIGYTGIQNIGDKYIYAENCLHQPTSSYWQGFDGQYSSPSFINNTLYSSYHLCDQNPETIPLLADNTVGRTPVERTSLYIYCLFLAVNNISSDPHPIYHGQIGRYVYSTSNPPVISLPNIVVNNSGGAAFYRYEKFAEWDSKFNFYRIVSAASNSGLPVKPNYLHLLNGYYLDPRAKLSEIEIIPTETKTIQIEYYQVNKFEPIPSLSSIDVCYYTINLVKDKPSKLPIADCVMGTLYCDDPNTINLISNISQSGKYSGKYFLEANLPELFSEWNTLYDIALNTPLTPPVISFTPILTQYQYQVESRRDLKVIGANNNYWNNRDTPTPDRIPNFPHPMFLVDNQRAFNWHIKPQSDDSFGDLVMNSPLLVNIGKSLDVATWSVNLDDPDLPRVDNLGWRIQRICDIAGIRVNPDGTINKEKEKKLVRQVIDSKKRLDDKLVGVTVFGELGMVMKRITNRFKGKTEIVSDQCVIIQDIPQMIQEYFEQINLALGIQESSAVEIKQGEKGEIRARFSSQLEILIELVNLLSSGNEMSRAALVSSLITQSQTNELIAGLGLPSVTKTIPVKIDKNIHQIPFKGIAAHRSISQEIATCTYNVGIVLGQVL
jgi:hypothetical protein